MKPLDLGPSPSSLNPNARFRGLLGASPVDFSALASRLVAEELFERVRCGRHGGSHADVTIQRLSERLSRYRGRRQRS